MQQINQPLTTTNVVLPSGQIPVMGKVAWQ